MGNGSAGTGQKPKLRAAEKKAKDGVDDVSKAIYFNPRRSVTRECVRVSRLL